MAAIDARETSPPRELTPISASRQRSRARLGFDLKCSQSRSTYARASEANFPSPGLPPSRAVNYFIEAGAAKRPVFGADPTFADLSRATRASRKESGLLFFRRSYRDRQEHAAECCRSGGGLRQNYY